LVCLSLVFGELLPIFIAKEQQIQDNTHQLTIIQIPSPTRQTVVLQRLANHAEKKKKGVKIAAVSASA
jgi:hypothetical protein